MYCSNYMRGYPWDGVLCVSDVKWQTNAQFVQILTFTLF